MSWEWMEGFAHITGVAADALQASLEKAATDYPLYKIFAVVISEDGTFDVCRLCGETNEWLRRCHDSLLVPTEGKKIYLVDLEKGTFVPGVMQRGVVIKMEEKIRAIREEADLLEQKCMEMMGSGRKTKAASAGGAGAGAGASTSDAGSKE